MAKNLTKRFEDIEKKIKHKYAVEIIRFVKPEDEKFLVECSNLKTEIGKHLAATDLDKFENSITFIESINE